VIVQTNDDTITKDIELSPLKIIIKDTQCLNTKNLFQSLVITTHYHRKSHQGNHFSLLQYTIHC